MKLHKHLGFGGPKCTLVFVNNVLYVQTTTMHSHNTFLENNELKGREYRDGIKRKETR